MMSTGSRICREAIAVVKKLWRIDRNNDEGEGEKGKHKSQEPMRNEFCPSVLSVESGNRGG